MRPFFKLAVEFIVTHGIDASVPHEDNFDSLEFAHEGLTCKAFPSNDELAVVLEVRIARLDGVAEQAQFRLLHLLHRLNAAARLTHGALASVDTDDNVIIFKVLEIGGLTPLQLAVEMADLFQCARRLGESMDMLADPPGTVLSAAPLAPQPRHMPPATEPPSSSPVQRTRIGRKRVHSARRRRQ